VKATHPVAAVQEYNTAGSPEQSYGELNIPHQGKDTQLGLGKVSLLYALVWSAL